MAKQSIKPELLNTGKYIEGLGIIKLTEDLTASDAKALIDNGLSEVFEVAEPKKVTEPKKDK